MENLKAVIESLLFVSEEPLTVETLRKLLDDLDPVDIRAALADLEAEYTARQGGFHLKAVAGGWQFRSRTEFTPWIRKLIQPNAPRLSKAALETLAIIAYKQPVIRSDIEQIRGVDCGGVTRMLLERKLIRILGRKEIPGRPLIYATTKLFLQIFDLKDLTDLPSPKEIEAMALDAPPEAGKPLREDDDGFSDLGQESLETPDSPEDLAEDAETFDVPE
ncbi:MAG: SMC-Scp complex subunit ScpB [Pseudomonadota bacterium]